MIIKRILLLMLFISFMLSINMMKLHALDDEYFFMFTPMGYDDDGDYYFQANSSFIEVPSGSSTLYLYIPDVHDCIQESVTIDTVLKHSQVSFYIDEDTPDYTTFILKDSYDINTDSMAISANIELITITLLLKFDPYIAGRNQFRKWFNENFEYTFDSEPDALSGSYIARFYSNFSVYYETYYDTIPVEPYPPNRLNYVFDGWYIDGQKYEFEEPLLEPDYGETFENTYYLTSRASVYVPPESGDFIDPGTTDSRIVDVLTSFGLYNYPGFIIIFVIVSIFLSGIMLYFGLPSFIILIVNTLLATLWIFLGWFPTYITILFGLALISGIIIAFKNNKGGLNA